ncbi:MAG: hypothetical protein LUQ56_04375 [Methylococcaceae bacterium]|nr:hypothetical protein [Methylococcaceae bacterium]
MSNGVAKTVTIGSYCTLQVGLYSVFPHYSVCRVTVLSLPDISLFNKETAVGKLIVVSIVNHRNVGSKQPARPIRLGCS